MRSRTTEWPLCKQNAGQERSFFDPAWLYISWVCYSRVCNIQHDFGLFMLDLRKWRLSENEGMPWIGNHSCIAKAKECINQCKVKECTDLHKHFSCPHTGGSIHILHIVWACYWGGTCNTSSLSLFQYMSATFGNNMWTGHVWGWKTIFKQKMKDDANRDIGRNHHPSTPTPIPLFSFSHINTVRELRKNYFLKYKFQSLPTTTDTGHVSWAILGEISPTKYVPKHFHMPSHHFFFGWSRQISWEGFFLKNPA